MARICIEHRLAASAAQVFAVYAQRSFLTARYAESGLAHYTIHRHEQLHDRAEIQVELAPAGALAALPESWRRKLGMDPRLNYRMQWQRLAERGYHGQFSYLLQGREIGVRGQLWLDEQRLDEQANACLLRCEADTFCALPLLGRLVEPVLADQVRKELQADWEALATRLA